ncbi:MAG TPA: HD domain-containing phosphohydrolase [Vicinamibacterales bacterium]|nr:HD domain-containing phosphohydrolase [Vicinamibacterales bacterium]
MTAAALALALQGTDRIFPLPPGATLTAGRVPQCDIHLDDLAVSRRHCTFTGRGSEAVVTDLGSANGTYVNDRAVGSATIRAGDVVRIGGTVLECRDGARPMEPAAPRAVPDADEGLQSVISRRIEPSKLEWLSSATMGAAPLDLALLERAQRHLTTLHRISEALALARDVAALQEAALQTIFDVLQPDRTAIVLRRDGPDGDFEVAAVRVRTPAAAPFVVSRTLVADVIARGVSTFAHDASADARFAEGKSVIGQRIRSVMSVPLRTSDEILGALYVDSQSGAGRFTEADLELMAAIGNQIGVALHRVRLLGEIERLLLDTIRAIAATIDAKDGYTHRHSERVAAIARALAAEMGLASADQETAQLSALLHDVGKIAVPDSILNKPDRLTPGEYEEMRKHPEHGARILSNIQSPLVRAVLPGVRYHHEKWDGTGYPEGRRGVAIPLLGRLLGVADVLDALTSARAYRAPSPLQDVVDHIARCAGTAYDPEVAAAVVRLHERGALAPLLCVDASDSRPTEVGP